MAENNDKAKYIEVYTQCFFFLILERTHGPEEDIREHMEWVITLLCINFPQKKRLNSGCWNAHRHHPHKKKKCFQISFVSEQVIDSYIQKVYWSTQNCETPWSNSRRKTSSQHIVLIPMSIYKQSICKYEHFPSVNISNFKQYILWNF